MENVVMETLLKIQPKGRISGKNIIGYRKRLRYILDTSAAEIFENNYVYGEWEKIMDDTVGFHVLYFVFGVNDTYITYGHMIARLSAFIKVLSDTSVKVSDMTTEVQVKVTVGSRGIYSLSGDNSRLYDADSNNEYTLIKPFIIPASFRNKHRMHLLPKHVCHRVAVTSREIVVQGKYFGRLVRTDKRVDFEWNKKRAQQYLVCVNDFIDVAHLNGRNALDVTGGHWLDSIRFEYIFGGVTAGTVLLLLVLIAFKAYRGRRIAESPDE
ncbi:hypothetical protein MAR_015170 [Mya arenaria]|uniref:Uncharacterized protein n=1 Tax=Mya arenaria TaxID=6604 RepID=A0ABY7FJV3_MYAAR|nr:hypothetical protein MAR_015170 [Mya arenaria]